jgi:hypothetical protein
MTDCSPALPKLVHKKGSGVAAGNEFHRKTLAAPALGAANVFEVEIEIENYRTPFSYNCTFQTNDCTFRFIIVPFISIIAPLF